MRRILNSGLALAVAGSVMVGCTDELPTAAGGGLIGEGFRTYEVVLEADAFLQSDTTYTGIGRLNFAPFGLVAEAFGGELYAHTLVRVVAPRSVTYETGGTSVTDSVFTVVGGTLTLVVDTIGVDEPVSLQLLEVTESWHAPSVTWEQRFDTAGVSAAWTQPGGTTDRLLGDVVWQGADTIRIPLDSTAAAIWTDSAAAFHGGLVRSATEGSRVRIQTAQFEFDVRPEGADTVVTGGSLQTRVAVATPEPSTPDQTELRVGGIPIWRSAFHFRPLEDVQLPCPPGSPQCTPRSLSDVQINLAALLLRPVPVAGRRIERPLRLESRAILRAPGVPVTRSALSPAIGVMPDNVEPDQFTETPAEPGPVAVPLTNYVRQNLDPPEGEDPVRWMAVLAQAEQQAPLFGYTAFGSMESDIPPQLRLVVTVPTED